MSGALLATAHVKRPRHPLTRVLLLVAALLLGLVALIAWCWTDAQRYPIAALARTAPQSTAMMRQRAAEAARSGRALRIDQRWVPYDRISPMLRRAVLVAEDDAFFEHGGFDWNEINASMRANLEKHRVVRGGSTITQQLARNLFLGDGRNPTRKLTEAFIAMRLERTLGKRRIFELYLNLIEWGDGVFGIEAASRHDFGVSAAGLNARQAVLLAAVIINPRRFSVSAPTSRIQRRARIIASRLRRRGLLPGVEYELAIDAPAGSILPTTPSAAAIPLIADSSLNEPVGTMAPEPGATAAGSPDSLAQGIPR